MSVLVVLFMAMAAAIYVIHPILKADRTEAAIEARVATLRAARRTAAHPDAPLACPACSNPLRPGDSFCPRCGKRRPSPCPHCGRQPAPGDLYCAACGTCLEGEGPQ